MENYAGLTDEELLRRRGREREAFLVFYGRHASVLFDAGVIESGSGC